jgi:hypothetical protein
MECGAGCLVVLTECIALGLRLDPAMQAIYDELRGAASEL